METSILQWKEDASIRMQMVEGEPWFAAKDVCEVLDIKNNRDAIRALDDDEKGSLVPTPLVENRNLRTSMSRECTL